VVVFSIMLLLFPTLLMGATLPLLVEHFVTRSGCVGLSVSRLYFANTLGSAIACYLCATYVMKNFGQSGSVTLAACFNTLVGASAYMYGRGQGTVASAKESQASVVVAGPPILSLTSAGILAGSCGFLSLGFEIIWFRVFSLASADRAPAFALLLATYLTGIAAGAYLTEKLTEGAQPSTLLRTMGLLLLIAGASSVFLPPLVANLVHHDRNYLWSAPAFFLVAGMVGCVLPLLCQVSIGANEEVGRKVSLLYACNIVGAVLGSLGIGFVWMQHAGLRLIALQLAVLSIVIGAGAILLAGKRILPQPAWVWATIVLAAVSLPLSGRTYALLFEKLTFGKRAESAIPFTHIVENRNGVVCVTADQAVFGGAVYDGHFLISPANDENYVVRAFVITGAHPAPKRVLMIGLASGSWAQILINDPRVQKFDVVEINPGYLDLIPQYSVVSSLLKNPKLNLFVDDGRRWLLAHPAERYDLIVANSTYHWRDHSTTLLSREFLQLVRQHLNPGGIYYYNTTESDEAMATGLSVYPYGLRIVNFLAVSDSPIVFDRDRWLNLLSTYQIDGRPVFDPLDPKLQQVLAIYRALAGTVNAPPRFFGLETSESMRVRLGRQHLITDDNMGREWAPQAELPWRQ